MPANAVADRLKRLRTLTCLLVIAATAATGASAATPGVFSTAVLASGVTADVLSTAIGRYYEAENESVSEAYVAHALARGAPVGNSEACVLPDGRRSRRPTVLANPPLAAASILQRIRLVSALAAYEVALAAIARRDQRAAVAQGDSRSATALNEDELLRRASQLEVAAKLHATGDLFVEDASAAFDFHIQRVARARDHATEITAIEAADATTRKLLSILSDDVKRQRVETLDASALAADAWRTYAAGTTSMRGDSRDGGDIACSEPAIYARAVSPPDPGRLAPTRPPGLAGSPPRALAGSRLACAQRRARALEEADAIGVVAALAAAYGAYFRAAFTEPSTEDAQRDARATATRLERETQTFANAVRLCNN